MFSTVLSQITGYLNRRLILTLWLPSLLFWVALLGLVVARVGPEVALDWWNARPVELRLLYIILGLAWITFFAYSLSAQLGTLIRLYEGYWEDLPGARCLMEGRKAYYRAELARLKEGDKANYGRIYLLYPPAAMPDEVMPTRLGNILKNSELYPMVRYNMDAVLIWPRLYNVLPDPMVENIGAAREQMDLMVVVSVLGAGFALLGGVIALLILPWYAFPACLWGGALIAWLGYEGTLRSALPYTQLIKSAFDLHRGTLLKALSWELPKSYGEERRRWRQIGHLWYRGAPEGQEGALALGYPGAKESEEKKPERGFLPLRIVRQISNAISGLFEQEGIREQGAGNQPTPAAPRGSRGVGQPARGTARAAKGSGEQAPMLKHLGRRLGLALLVAGVIGGVAAGLRQQLVDPPIRQEIPLPARAIPAYQPITLGDLTSATRVVRDLPEGTLTQTAQLSGTISLAHLTAQQPITKGQVLSPGDPSLFSGRAVIAVEGGPALVFGGGLGPGDVVSAWAGSRPIARHLLVLDVKEYAGGESGEGPARYTVTLAVPVAKQGDLLAAAGEGRLFFTIAP